MTILIIIFILINVSYEYCITIELTSVKELMLLKVNNV